MAKTETIQAIEDTNNGKNLSKTFDSVDKMFNVNGYKYII